MSEQWLNVLYINYNCVPRLYIQDKSIFKNKKSDSTKQIAFKAKSNSKMRKSNLVYGVQIALIQGLDVCKQIYTASQVGNEP